MSDSLEDQWKIVESVLEQAFPGTPWRETTGRAYRLMLSDYSPMQVIGALKVLQKKGGRFRPSTGDIVGVLEKDVDRLAWPQVEDWLLGEQGVLRGSWSEESVVAAAAQVDRVLASFVQSKTLAALKRPLFDDPKWGEKARNDLRREYEDFEERADERIVRGLELPGAARIAGALEKAQVADAIGAPPERAALGAGEDGEHDG